MTGGTVFGLLKNSDKLKRGTTLWYIQTYAVHKLPSLKHYMALLKNSDILKRGATVWYIQTHAV